MKLKLFHVDGYQAAAAKASSENITFYETYRRRVWMTCCAWCKRPGPFSYRQGYGRLPDRWYVGDYWESARPHDFNIRAGRWRCSHCRAVNELPKLDARPRQPLRRNSARERRGYTARRQGV